MEVKGTGGLGECGWTWAGVVVGCLAGAQGPRVPGSLWVWEARNLTKQGLDPHAGSGGGQGDRSRVACASAADPRVETQGF